MNATPHSCGHSPLSYLLFNPQVGETVTALQRGTLQPGGREVLIYSTILGGLGTLFPFASREDLDFFQHLELHMRAEAPPLLGRDHLAFRCGCLGAELLQSLGLQQGPKAAPCHSPGRCALSLVREVPRRAQCTGCIMPVHQLPTARCPGPPTSLSSRWWTGTSASNLHSCPSTSSGRWAG